MRNIEKLGFNEQDYEIYKDCFKNTFTSRIVVSKDNVYQKHDKIFKKILKNLDEMVLFLRIFAGLNVEFDNLEIYNCNFITKDFHRRESDIVYKQINKDIYYIVEHQSKMDKDMSRRILEYCVELMREIKQNKNIIKNPLVIPIVIYTGDSKWNIPTVFSDTQQTEVENEEYAIKSKYKLIDKNQYSIEYLKGLNSRVSKMLVLEKCKNNNELAKILKYFAETSKKEDLNWINGLVQYVFQNTLSTEQTKEILEIIKKKDGNEEMEEIIERIKRNERIRDKKNIKKGRKENQIETAKRMKLKNMSINEILEITGLTKNEILKIK